MKKTLICLLAVLALSLCVLTLTPNARAEEASDPILYHCKCGNKHSTALDGGEITWKEGTTECYDACDGVILEWTPWGADSNKNAGNYYFVQDYTTARGFTSSAIDGLTINVDMNGYNILVTSAARAVNIQYGNVTFCNTKTTGGSVCGYGSAKDAAAIYQWGASSLTLYGVDVSCYNGGNSIKNGGAVYVNDTASFTTYGGSITGCAVSNGTVAAYGGTLFVKKTANVSLNGTTISGGSVAGSGGNIYVEDGRTGSFTMNGCVVYGGTATQYANAAGNKDTGYGGNIYLGTVAADGPLAIMADSTVYGGTAVSGGSLMTKCRLAMQGGSIGIDTEGNEAGGVATNRGGSVFINNCELVMNLGAVIAGGNSGSSNGGNIYIHSTGSGALTMNHTSTVKNGYTSGNGGNVYVNNGTVTMTGNSSITGGDATNLGGNVVMVEGSFAMKGASYIAGGGVGGVYGTETAKGTCKDGGNVYIGAAATFTMEGTGNVRNGMVTGNGSQTANFMVNGTLNIGGSSQVYGGIVGAQKRNIHVFSGGTLNISGNAKVDGGITAAGGTVKLSGDITVDTYKDSREDRTIYLAAAVVLDATGLGENAVVKLYDSATATGGRKLATVTSEQTGIKSTVSILGTKLSGWVITRERDADGNVTLWLREEANVAASASTSEGYYDYASFADALQASDGTVILLNDVDGATVSKSILLDLNGNNMTNAVIPAGVTVSGKDSATDDYDCTDGYGTLSGTVEGEIAHDIKTTGTVKRYLAVCEDGVYSFHRFYLGITHMSLKPGVTGVGYKAVFYGDSKVAQQLSGYGYNLWLDGFDKVVNASKDGATFVSGNVLTLRLQNFDVAAYGDTGVNANVFVTLKDGKTITSSGYSYTLKGLLEQVDTMLEQLSDTQIAALQTMCKNNIEAMNGWSISNILNWTAE